MKLTRKYKYQAGGALGMECPEVAQNPQLNSQNEAQAVNDPEIAYTPTGGTQQQGCSNCALFDISQRMNQCTQEGGGEIGLCWPHQFKCQVSGVCRQWEQGGPITDDQMSYKIGSEMSAPPQEMADPAQPIEPIEQQPPMDPSMMAPAMPAVPQLMKYGGEVPQARFGGQPCFDCGGSVHGRRKLKRYQDAGTTGTASTGPTADTSSDFGADAWYGARDDAFTSSGANLASWAPEGTVTIPDPNYPGKFLSTPGGAGQPAAPNTITVNKQPNNIDGIWGNNLNRFTQTTPTQTSYVDTIFGDTTGRQTQSIGVNQEDNCPPCPEELMGKGAIRRFERDNPRPPGCPPCDYNTRQEKRQARREQRGGIDLSGVGNAFSNIGSGIGNLFSNIGGGGGGGVSVPMFPGGGSLPQANYGYSDNYGNAVQGTPSKGIQYINDNRYNPNYHRSNFPMVDYTSAFSTSTPFNDLINLATKTYGIFDKTKNAITNKRNPYAFKNTEINNPTGRAIATDYTTNDAGNLNLMYADENSDLYKNVTDNSYFTDNKLNVFTGPTKDGIPDGSTSLTDYFANIESLESGGKDAFLTEYEKRARDKGIWKERYGGSLPKAQFAGGYGKGINLNLPKTTNAEKVGIGAGAGLGFLSSFMNPNSNIAKNIAVNKLSNELCTANTCPTGSKDPKDYVNFANMQLGYGEDPNRPGYFSKDGYASGNVGNAFLNTAGRTLGGAGLGWLTGYGGQWLGNKLAPRTFRHPGRLFKEQGGSLPKAQENLNFDEFDGFNSIMGSEQYDFNTVPDFNFATPDPATTYNIDPNQVTPPVIDSSDPFDLSDYDPTGGNAFMINKYAQSPSGPTKSTGSNFTTNQSEDPYADGVTSTSTYGKSFFEPGKERRAYRKGEADRLDGLKGKAKREEKRKIKGESWDLDEDGERDQKYGAKEFNQIREKLDKPLDIFGSFTSGVVEAAQPLTHLLKNKRWRGQAQDMQAQRMGAHNNFETEEEGLTGQQGDFTLLEGDFREEGDRVWSREAKDGGGLPIAQQNNQPIGPYNNPYIKNIGASIKIPIGGGNQGEIRQGKTPMSKKIQDFLGMNTEQTYNIPRLNIESGKWEDNEYKTSFMNELKRSGHPEGTFTFTSAGGPGVGSRWYFPYSDPMGIGAETDIDPTGPGAGILLNNFKLREWSNSLANTIGDNSVGNFFKDLNLPPGFTYAGVEMAGNLPAPFVGATVSLDDTERLENWLKLPQNQALNMSAEAFKHVLGPALWAWNQGPEIGGKLKLSNPMNVMGKPLAESMDFFGGRKIHNPFSGTGEGLFGKTGLRGGNFIPHKEFGNWSKYLNFPTKFTEPLEMSVRGGFEAIKDEVLAAAKQKGISPQKAYAEIAGKLDLGKYINKTGIPKGLDIAGEALYGTKGAAAYNKSGTTLANMLRNINIPYGQFINHPWLWKNLARGLIAPDVLNLLSGATHQPGQPVREFWSPQTGFGIGDEELQKSSQYGMFPTIQHWLDERDPVDFFKENKEYNQQAAENQIGNKLYDEGYIKKHGVAEDITSEEEVWYDKNGKKVNIPKGVEVEYRNTDLNWIEPEMNFFQEMLPSYMQPKGKYGKEEFGYEASYRDPKTGQYIDLWSYDMPLLKQSSDKAVEIHSNRISKQKEDLNKRRTRERIENQIANPFMGPKFRDGGEVVDVDERMLKELIAAGAQIENI